MLYMKSPKLEQILSADETLDGLQNPSSLQPLLHIPQDLLDLLQGDFEVHDDKQCR
jgi:hypothetical protein